MKGKSLLWLALLLAVFVALFVCVSCREKVAAPDEVVALGTTHISGLDVSGSAVVGTGLTVTSGGATITDGGLTVTAGGATITDGGLTLSDDDLVVADDFRVTAQTSITVTNSAEFTPTGTYQPIAAAGEVTPTLAVTDTAGSRYSTGTLLVLINTADVTINLADSGNVKTSGATALGQYDSLVLWFDGTYWIEIAQANN